MKKRARSGDTSNVGATETVNVVEWTESGIEILGTLVTIKPKVYSLPLPFVRTDRKNISFIFDVTYIV